MTASLPPVASSASRLMSDVPSGASESPSGATLPAPSGQPVDGAGLLVVLAKLLEQIRDTELQAKQLGVQRHGQECQKAIKDAFEAQKKAAENENSKGGFFSDIKRACGDVLDDAVHLKVARMVEDLKDDTVTDPQFWKDLAASGATVAKWAAVVGSIVIAAGLTATTGVGGVAMGLAIAAALMTTAGAAESEFGVLEKLGVDAKTAQWVGLGLSVAGAVAGAGAGWAATRSLQAARAASATAGAGGSATADAAQKSVAAASRVGRLTTEVGEAVVGLSAVGSGIGGIGKIGAAHFEAEALRAEADVVAATQKESRLRKLIQAVMKAMHDTYEDSSKAISGVSDTMAKHNAVSVQLWRAS